jgi:hypothetical protein
MIVSEGEQWWKLHVNIAVAKVPLLTWTSRRFVVPLLHGDVVLAAAFVTERARTMETYRQGDEDPCEVVWRHAEVHTAGRVINVLYRGLPDQLGARVDLTQRSETAGLNPEWAHGLPMLAGRVVNDLDDDDTLGVSDYDQITDELFALDEAITISTENTRLTAVDRIAVAGKFTQQDGSFDASMQVFQIEGDTGGVVLGEGSDGRPPIVQIEKRYDADPLWLHIDKLVRTILSRVGLVAEVIGDHSHSGGEVTAPAMRLRFVPTRNAAAGKLREWRHQLPRILEVMLLLAGLDLADGGCGQTVTKPERPSIEFGDALPEDGGEIVTQVVTAIAGEVMSRETGIRRLHPEWDDPEVDAELQRIRDDLGQELANDTLPARPGRVLKPPAPTPDPASGPPAT